MRAALAIAGAAMALAGAGATPAAAATIGTDEALKELRSSRAGVERSVDLYAKGKQDAAYSEARNAYLDHFEFVEIPLRVRDEGLTLELEEDFANLRNSIESGESKAEIEKIAGETSAGLDDVERELRSPGIGSQLLAFWFSFILLFREGLEAILIVAAILGYLQASRNQRYRPSVLKGIGLGVLASLVTFVALTAILDVAPVQRELLEAITAIAAVVVLFYVSFWLISRLEQRRWMEFISSKVWAAMTTGATFALGLVGFTAVYREGFETALLYQALFSITAGLSVWVAVGALTAAAGLGAIGYLVFKAGTRIPAKAMLGVAVAMVMAMSIAFVGNAVRELQQAAVLPVTYLENAPQLPIFLADLTGYFPTTQSILAQIALFAIYIAGAVWMFVLMPARERHAARRVSREAREQLAKEA